MSPNPSHGLFLLTIETAIVLPNQLQVTDFTDKMVFQKNLATHGQLEEQPDLSFLPNGMYLLKIENEKQWGAQRKVILP
ncbi:MAG: T9SS type A sorting domain-containing protein [Bacteroidota bacterium]